MMLRVGQRMIRIIIKVVGVKVTGHLVTGHLVTGHFVTGHLYSVNNNE